MSSTPQFFAVLKKPIRALGAIGFVLGVIHCGLAAIDWSHHNVTPEASGLAAIGILIRSPMTHAIAGRGAVRNWSKVGLWFFLGSVVIQIALTPGLSVFGVQPR